MNGRDIGKENLKNDRPFNNHSSNCLEILLSFIFTLDESADFLLRQIESNSELISLFDIGYDDQTDTTYKALVSLEQIPGEPQKHYELSFLITEFDQENQEVLHNDGQSTKSFLVGDNRNKVLAVICQVACHLAESSRARILIINTVQTYLPEKALAKYDTICASLRSHGYEGRRVDSYHGAEQWQIIKN